MSKRNLTSVLTRVLRRHGIHCEAERDGDTADIAFEVETAASAVHADATVVGNDFILFVVPAGIQVPGERRRRSDRRALE